MLNSIPQYTDCIAGSYWRGLVISWRYLNVYNNYACADCKMLQCREKNIVLFSRDKTAGISFLYWNNKKYKEILYSRLIRPNFLWPMICWVPTRVYIFSINIKCISVAPDYNL